MNRNLTYLVAGCGMFLGVSGCSLMKGGPCTGPCTGPCNRPCRMDTSTWTAFGEKTKLAAAEAVPVNLVLDDLDKYAGKSVRVCGQVRSVCAHRGCWLRLGGPAGEDTVFVKFTCPVEGRLIPMEAVGHRAVVEGTLQVKEISVEEARHYQEDAGASPEELAKVTAPQKQITLLAPTAAVDLAGPKS